MQLKIYGRHPRQEMVLRQWRNLGKQQRKGMEMPDISLPDVILAVAL